MKIKGIGAAVGLWSFAIMLVARAFVGIGEAAYGPAAQSSPK